MVTVALTNFLLKIEVSLALCRTAQAMETTICRAGETLLTLSIYCVICMLDGLAGRC